MLRWLKRVGEPVAAHEAVLELETDKVTVEVAAPASGALLEILANEGDRVEPGAVLGRLDAAGLGAGLGAGTELGRLADAGPEAAPPAGGATARSVEPGAAAAQRLSPAVRRLAAERGVDLARVKGTGLDGRITARDVEAFGESGAAAVGQGSRRVPHTAMRRRIAERMAQSMATVPHVTSVFEADLTRVLAAREAQAADFAARGVRLTLSAYFVTATVAALRAVPEVNSSYHADAMELHDACNIGIGTALPGGGLIVPVLSGAERLDLFAIASKLEELTAAARGGTLSAGDLKGGTFTISNHGVSGSLLAAPIVIVPPQVAILGIGKLTRRPAVIGAGSDEQLSIRPMCYVTLTIDHRALDGFQANAFLTALVRALEEWPHPGQ